VGANVSHVYAGAGSFTATVTASNTFGPASATTSVRVVNLPPVANAGADQTVSVSGTVLLSGGNSGDADGHTPLSYRWRQTGGPFVTLSNPTDVSPNFVAPGVPGVLTFTLTVSDSRGLADATPDEVVIRVLDIGISGLSVTSSSPTVLGQSTRFTATASVGSNVAYTWDFGDGAEVSLSPTRGDVNTTHTYAAPGTYTAIVTARNGQGTVTAQTTVVVNKRVGHAVYLPLVRK
jgi:PKD repeat protein